DDAAFETHDVICLAGKRELVVAYARSGRGPSSLCAGLPSQLGGERPAARRNSTWISLFRTVSSTLRPSGRSRTASPVALAGGLAGCGFSVWEPSLLAPSGAAGRHRRSVRVARATSA